MQRRHFIRNAALLGGAFTVVNKNMLTMLTDDPWKITMLTDHIGIFTEKGGTIAFLLTKDGIAVVDAQFPEQSQHLIDELKKRSEQPVKLLINTHHHADHTAGNISFKGITEHVLAHSNSKINQEKVAQQNNTTAQQLFPDEVFGTLWSQKFGPERITLHYFGAGHTNGDAIIHFEHANIVHMGDLVFNRRHPFVDRSAGANMQSWIEVLAQASAKFSKKTRFIFGHSGNGFDVTGTKEDLKRYSEYLEQVLNFVRTQIKQGKSKEEVLKITELPFETEWKGDGLQRPLQAAYEELTQS